MPRRPFLPGFTLASPAHRAYVRYPEREAELTLGAAHPDPADIARAYETLAIVRQFASALGAVGVNEMPPVESSAQTAAEGWRTLYGNAVAWLGGHISQMKLQEVRGRAPGEVRAGVVEAASEGAATGIAYLEVLPKKLFRREFDDPNAEIAEWARSSTGFIVDWASLDGQTDYSLAWALASPKPRVFADVFKDLHYNPKWFISYDDERHVTLDPAKVPNLVDHTGRNPLTIYDPHEVVLGCGGMRLIPRMHGALTDQAEALGLFGQTYLEMRGNHGYPEAWEALGWMATGRTS